MKEYVDEDLKDIELEIYEQEENLRELKKQRDLIKRNITCSHIYIKNGYSSSEVINNKREIVEIIECIKCGNIAKIKCGRFI